MHERTVHVQPRDLCRGVILWCHVNDEMSGYCTGFFLFLILCSLVLRCIVVLYDTGHVCIRAEKDRQDATGQR
ncbi:MAG: hypothetical protein CSA32_02070 [Desulfobulbus propionicus]|nr:MAG: hypothetical protein CSA32_02070 [Desulfobulbus propionicus]